MIVAPAGTIISSGWNAAPAPPATQWTGHGPPCVAKEEWSRGCQSRVKKIGSRYRVECFQGERVNGHCPSVDVLFDSVAKEAGDRAVGILLTGMGYDGARGLLAMRRKGARTIGQDEASSVVYGMPKVAFDIGGVERQAALGAIPQVLAELLG